MSPSWWQWTLTVAAALAVALWVSHAEKRRPWIGVVAAGTCAAILLVTGIADLVAGVYVVHALVFTPLGVLAAWWCWHQWRRLPGRGAHGG